MKQKGFNFATIFSLTNVLSLFVLYFALVGLFSYNVKRIMLDDLYDYGTTYIKDVAFVVSDMLISENFIEMQEFTLEASERKNIYRVTVSDETGIIIADSDIGSIGVEEADHRSHECRNDGKICIRGSEDGRFIYFRYPVDVYGANYGHIVTALSTDAMMSTFTKTRQKGMMTALVFLFFGVGFGILVSKKVSAPIREMVFVADEVAQGRYPEVHTVSKVREIGSLTLSIREMFYAIKSRESELNTTKSYLENILESMPSMIITFDKEGIVTQWNSAISTYSGIKAEDALGKVICDILPFMPGYADQIRTVVKSGETVELFRISLQDDLRLFNMVIFPIASNGVEGVGVRFDDVTELETMNQQLLQAQKMETMGNLAGGLAHDFNNALSGVLGTLSLLSFRLDNQMDVAGEELKKYIKTMETSGVRASEIVKQLLTISRQHDANMQACNLIEILQEIESISSSIFDKSVSFNIVKSNQNYVINADKGQLDQVFMNICINACHSMTIMRNRTALWGGIISAYVEPFYADEMFIAKHPEAHIGHYYVTNIRDTGVGMDTEVVHKIFDPFFSTKEETKGTGLGLSMVYNIVKQHNGFIDVYSEKDHGTLFKIYLPVAEKTTDPMQKDERYIFKSGEGTILVVDDEEIVRETAKELLEALGYQVVMVENGDEGVKYYKEHQDRIDLVLLDMVMPVKSGKEAYIELKQLNPNIKVVLASGFRQDDRVQEVIDMGVNAFLQKPYVLDTLAETIETVLQKR